MPDIEITPEQEERLRALQEEIARDVVGKYGHVRPRDAVEYLLDRYENDDATADVDTVEPVNETGDGTGDADESNADDATSSGDATDGTDATARVVSEGDDDADAGGDDAMLDEMMNLLDTHDDKWGESSGDERYAVELPDGSSEQVRTKDDVKALLFKHYR
ncbi:hypothetical protein [Haloplanus halobius]|uniref:hypothetical protein n=1 Tax=Haloplanus halobius TaxID=2934938 RepID=UPI00200F160D|nr:hypothetical protein [Haloplanus sp. XH21]